jgi:hypothetical protein
MARGYLRIFDVKMSNSGSLQNLTRCETFFPFDTDTDTVTDTDPKSIMEKIQYDS